MLATRSPTLTRVTLSPTAATTPAAFGQEIGDAVGLLVELPERDRGVLVEVVKCGLVRVSCLVSLEQRPDRLEGDVQVMRFAGFGPTHFLFHRINSLAVSPDPSPSESEH